MPGLDFSELLVIGVVALIFVKPTEIPHLARRAGQMYGQLRRMADELRRSLVLEADRMDEETRLRNLHERRLKAEEDRRKAQAAAGEGTMAQPVPAPVEQPPSTAAAEPLPPGFSQEEWDDLPEHIREIVLRRRAAS